MEEEKTQQIHKQYGSLLYRVAFSYVKHKADAEDAVQELYIRLLQNRPEFETKDHEKAWLIRVLINICKDMLKSAWNSRTVGFDEITEGKKEELILPYGIQDDTIWIVMSLEEKYRLPLYLFYYEGYSIKEIAGILEIPEATVKTHLRRGREEVKKHLEE